jgi:hypothetical protein
MTANSRNPLATLRTPRLGLRRRHSPSDWSPTSSSIFQSDPSGFAKGGPWVVHRKSACVCASTIAVMFTDVGWAAALGSIWCPTNEDQQVIVGTRSSTA